MRVLLFFVTLFTISCIVPAVPSPSGKRLSSLFLIFMLLQ